MEEIVKEILIQNEGYLSRSAAVTAKDLVRIQDEEIHNALIHWVHTGEKQDVIRGEFSCVQLMDLHKMKYPAALQALMFGQAHSSDLSTYVKIGFSERGSLRNAYAVQTKKISCFIRGQSSGTTDDVFCN